MYSVSKKDYNGNIIPDFLKIHDEFFFECLIPNYNDEVSLNIGKFRTKTLYTPILHTLGHIW